MVGVLESERGVEQTLRKETCVRVVWALSVVRVQGSGFGGGTKKAHRGTGGGSWMGSFQYSRFGAGLIGYRSQLLGSGFGVQKLTGWIVYRLSVYGSLGITQEEK